MGKNSISNNKQKIEIIDADKKLKSICQQGLKSRFGEFPPDAVKERLEYELDVVAKNMHSEYYLVASMLAKEALRLHHAIFFRGTITSSFIAYTSGISDINPMEEEYGGVKLPFEITGEEYMGAEPTIDIQCSVAYILYAQSFLCREFPEYRCLSFPIVGDAGLRTIRVYLVRREELPVDEVLDEEGANLEGYPDFIYFNDYFRITLIGENQLELARYNKFYSEEVVFNEAEADNVIAKLWKYVKVHDSMLTDFKKMKVTTYEELITVLSMAYSTGVWEGMAKKLILDEKLSIAEMIGSRDDLFTYLVNAGFDKVEAFQIMNQVRLGKHLTEEQIDKMRDYGVAEWVIDLCGHVLYLFPRAHIAQLIRRDAFCLREP